MDIQTDLVNVTIEFVRVLKVGIATEHISIVTMSVTMIDESAVNGRLIAHAGGLKLNSKLEFMTSQIIL